MSESEAFEAQGRAYANLRKLKSEVATITADLRRRNSDLRELTNAVDQILAEPEREGYGRPVAHNIALKLRDEANVEKMSSLVMDLLAKSAEIRLLEEQISRF